MTQELTDEAREKKERLRKNLRWLALAAACYYFISAGFSFYEDSQAEKTRVVKDIPQALVSQESFIKVLQALLPGAEISIANPDGTGTVSNRGEDTLISVKPGQYDSVVFEFAAPFPAGGLSDKDMQALRTYLTACENTTESKTIDEIIRVLGLDKKSLSELTDGMGAGSKNVRYTLSAGDGSIQISATVNR